MYTYTKVFNKGSLSRYITKVFNNSVAKKNFAKGCYFPSLKITGFRVSSPLLGSLFRSPGGSVHLRGPFLLNNEN